MSSATLAIVRRWRIHRALEQLVDYVLGDGLLRVAADRAARCDDARYCVQPVAVDSRRHFWRMSSETSHVPAHVPIRARFPLAWRKEHRAPVPPAAVHLPAP